MNLNLMRIIDYYVGIPLCFVLGNIDKLLSRISILSRRKKGAPEKILIIKTWGIGNIIMMLPLLKKIREGFPAAKISFFTMESNRDIVDNSPYIDNFFLVKTDSLHLFILSLLRNLYYLRKERFDLVLDFDQFSRCAALVAFFSGAPKRVGFDTNGQGKVWVFTHPVVYNNNQHMTITFSQIAEAAGIECVQSNPLAFPITAQDRMRVEEFLKGHQVYNSDLLIGMHVGCGENFPARKWPVENFAYLADRLIREFGVKIIFTGTLQEASFISEAIRLMPDSSASSNIIDSSGEFNIRQLAALIEKCKFIVSCDTGPVHIASAIGIPAVAFFGPNTPVLYGPRGDNHTIFYKNLPCSPCITNYNAKKGNCSNPKCITQITVDEVFKVIAGKYLKDIQNVNKVSSV